MLPDSGGVNVERPADKVVAPAARRVVQAFETPPSRRPQPPGWDPTSPLTAETVEGFLGSRFAGAWVASFDRSDRSAADNDRSVIERFDFLVAPDIVSPEQLFVVLRAVGAEGAGSGAAVPHLLWYSDRDELWRAGVYPIRSAQRPSGDTRMLYCGDANTPL